VRVLVALLRVIGMSFLTRLVCMLASMRYAVAQLHKRKKKVVVAFFVTLGCCNAAPQEKEKQRKQTNKKKERMLTWVPLQLQPQLPGSNSSNSRSRLAPT
jgi:hypothetical protein